MFLTRRMLNMLATSSSVCNNKYLTKLRNIKNNNAALTLNFDCQLKFFNLKLSRVKIHSNKSPKNILEKNCFKRG